MMIVRLIALDKQTGFRRVRVGETWQRLMSKCVRRVTGKEANDACGIEQLVRGVEEGTEGEIHAMRILWAHHSQEED